MRLGKRDPVNKKSVAFGQFLVSLPEFPSSEKAPTYSYPMDLNDQIGDCVVAGWDHTRQVVTGRLTGLQKNFTEEQILAFYKTQNPRYPAQDEGMVIQLFLEYLVNTGQILAFGRINHRNEEELKAAIYLGLSVMTGVQLQEVQMSQKKWDYKKDSPGIGGHCVPFAGYTGSTKTCISWGSLYECTDTFIDNQMDEAWFILMQEHIDHPNFRNHFNLKGFSDAIYQITEGKVKVPVISMSYTFTKQLTLGSTNNDVLQLQKYLNTHGFPISALDGPGSTGNETNYYGKATRIAVQKFQLAKGIVLSPTDAGYGDVGPKTRAFLNGPRKLVDAMILTESGGDDYAEGDKTLKDHAYGCLQIRQGVVDAVNSYLGTYYKSQQCLGDRALSLLIFNTYWKVYPQFVTDEDKAKCWNGGPGWKARYGKKEYASYTKNLDIYWASVKKNLYT